MKEIEKLAEVHDDIQFEKNDYMFNYRVAIVVKKDNKILIQRDTRAKHITLPGGRCELGESTADTAIREFKEETGIDTEIVKGLGMIENFFTSSFNGKKYHEILMIQEVKMIDKELYNKNVINNIEEKKKDFLTYEWLEIDKLKENNFKPEIIVNIIKSNYFIHYINKEY